MTRREWDAAAASFEADVFDITRAELGGHLRRTVSRRCLDGAKVAIDLGCGIGSMTRVLAGLCAEVYGVDYSTRMLGRARAGNVDCDNVTWVLADVSREIRAIPRADVLTCINVITSPSARVRKSIFRAAFEAVRQGGAAIFVVAALESAMHVDKTLGSRRAELRRRRYRQGLLSRGGVLQKHFSRAEASLSAANAGFGEVRLGKAIYGWAEEVPDRVRTVGIPRPWDWIIEAKRPGDDPAHRG
jgi:SAM-dependent methyltransferase